MASEAVVLLGYLGGSVPSDDQTCAEALSKFGGEAVWINGKKPEGYPFICSTCGVQLGFVCQLATPYCSNKRCLYLFGCHGRPECSKSARNWRAVRGVFEAQAEGSPQVAAANTEEKAGCADAIQEEEAADSSDWLEAAFGSRAGGEGASRADERREKRQPAAPSPGGPACAGRAVSGDELMPPFFLQVEAEPPDNSWDDATELRQSTVYLPFPQPVWGSCLFPFLSRIMRTSCIKRSVGCAPQVFLKLQKRLSRSPTQVVRYNFGGKPLFLSPLSEEEALSIGQCPLCCNERVFEMQLVPMAADEISRRYWTAKGEAFALVVEVVRAGKRHIVVMRCAVLRECTEGGVECCFGPADLDQCNKCQQHKPPDVR
ncbi:hypothetical protein Esti_001085 [Eimeria stiedai]